MEGAPHYIGGRLKCVDNINDLEIEKEFIKSGSYIKDYFTDLLIHVIKGKISVNKVKSWPKGFLDSNIGKSAKSIGKFNL